MFWCNQAYILHVRWGHSSYVIIEEMKFECRTSLMKLTLYPSTLVTLSSLRVKLQCNYSQQYENQLRNYRTTMEELEYQH